MLTTKGIELRASRGRASQAMAITSRPIATPRARPRARARPVGIRSGWARTKRTTMPTTTRKNSSSKACVTQVARRMRLVPRAAESPHSSAGRKCGWLKM